MAWNCGTPTSADPYLNSATSQMSVSFGWRAVYAPLTVR